MSLLRNKILSLSKGMHVRITHENGYTFEGIVDDNDESESLSLKVSSLVFLKYSQIMMLEDISQISAAHEMKTEIQKTEISEKNEEPEVNSKETNTEDKPKSDDEDHSESSEPSEEKTSVTDKQESEDSFYDGEIVKYNFFEEKGIITDSDNNEYIFEINSITDASLKSEIRKMSYLKFKKTDIEFKKTSKFGKMYACAIGYRKIIFEGKSWNSNEVTLENVRSLFSKGNFEKSADIAWIILNNTRNEEALSLYIQCILPLWNLNGDNGYSQKIRDVLENFGETEYKSEKTYKTLIQLYNKLGEHEKSLQCVDRIREMCGKGNHKTILYCLQQKAGLYYSLLDYQAAASQLIEWLEIVKHCKLKDKEDTRSRLIYAQLAEIYLKLGEIEKAEKYINKASDSEKKDEILRSLKEIRSGMSETEEERQESDEDVCDEDFSDDETEETDSENREITSEGDMPADWEAIYSTYTDECGLENTGYTDADVPEMINRFEKDRLYALSAWLMAASAIALSSESEKNSVIDPNMSMAQSIEIISRSFCTAFSVPGPEYKYTSCEIISLYECSRTLIAEHSNEFYAAAALRTLFGTESSQPDYYRNDLICFLEKTGIFEKYPDIKTLLELLSGLYTSTGYSADSLSAYRKNENEDKEDDCFVSERFAKARAEIIPLLEKLCSVTECNEKFSWGTYSIYFTASELLEKMKGTFSEEDRKFFFIRFLETDDVLLDKNYLPELCGTFCGYGNINILRRIEDHAFSKTGTLEKRITDIFSDCRTEHNFRSAKLIMKYARKKGIKELEERCEFSHYKECLKQAVLRFESAYQDFEDEVSLMEINGQISDENGEKAAVLRTAASWFEITRMTKDFGFYMHLLETLKENITDRSAALGVLLSEKLGELCSGRDDHGVYKYEFAQELINEGRYSSAEFVLECIEKNDTEEVSGNAHITSEVFDEFINEHTVNYRTVMNSAESLSGSVCEYAGKKDLKNALMYVTGRKGEEIADGMELIERWIPANGSERKFDVMPLLESLGLKPVFAGREENEGEIESYRVICSAEGSFTGYTIPQLESIAQTEGFRVSCLYGKYSCDSLMEKFAVLSKVPANTLVFLDCALNADQRRKLAEMLKKDRSISKAIIVVDRVVLFHLAKHYSKETVFSRLLAVTLPFSYCQPFGAGEDVSVSSDERTDRKTAVKLLTELNAYLGIRFDEKMISLVLAYTKCCPGRISLFCRMLAEAMREEDYAGYSELNAPCYEVTDVQIRKVIRLMKKEEGENDENR